MGMPWSEFNEPNAPARPALSSKQPKIGLTKTSWKMPASPGKPRKVFKPLGRKVKTAVQGDV